MAGLFRIRSRLAFEYLVVMLLVGAVPLGLLGRRLLDAAAGEQERHLLETHRDIFDIGASVVEVGGLVRWEQELRVIGTPRDMATGDSFALRDHLDLLRSGFPDILGAGLYGASGDRLAWSADPELAMGFGETATAAPAALLEPTRQLVSRVDARTIVGPVVPRSAGAALLGMALPVRLPDFERGVLVGWVSLSSLEKSLARLGAAHGVSLRLADGNGRSVLGSTLGPPGTALRSEPPLSMVGTESLRSSPVPVVYQTDQRRLSLVGVVATEWLGGSWFFVVDQSEVDSFGELADEQAHFPGWIWVGVLAAAAGTLFLWVWTVRPIHQIERAARQISDGDYQVQLDIERSDEIGGLADAIGMMAQNIQRHQDQALNRVLNEKFKTEAIVRSMADGLMVIDPGRKVAMINSQFERWFGIHQVNAVNRDYREVLPHSALVRHVDEALETHAREAYTSSLELNDSGDGPPMSLHVRTVRVIDPRREVVGLVTVLRDITREKRVEQMKSDLVSTVSHELRTPLTSIQGFSEILLEEDLEPSEAAEFAQIINTEARRLGSLISDFLDLSRIESGEIEIRQESVSLDDVLESSRVIMAQHAEARSMTIEMDKPEDKSIYLIGDADKLEQVLVNLLSNAVKYSPDGAQIGVQVTSDDAWVQLRVKDSGFGIPPASLPRIFDRFYRVDMTATSASGGTGLGLTIVREIVERHGGTVDVESEVGKGSVFTVALPLIGSAGSGA